MVRVGQTLCGKYRVEAAIDRGGMASVWLGTHISTGRRIAIKVLDDRFAGNAGVIERFGREARAASSIHHESIVEVLDLDRTEEGMPFLVMEFLEGGTLTSRIEKKGRLSEAEIIAIADPLLDALHAAHEAGVVHRDLKPDNIMLVPAGRRGEKVKVLDFGISSKSDEVSSLTTTGALLGTPHYMSPEQAKGRTDIDRRADVYAMGVVLYECAVGDVPFDAENYNALIQEIVNTEPVRPRARGAAISEAFEQVILQALAKGRDQRPTSADVLREKLLAVSVPAAPTSGSTSGSHALAPTPPEDRARKQMPTLDEAELVAAPSVPPGTKAAAPKPPPPPPPPPPPKHVSVPVPDARVTGRSPLESTPSTPPPALNLELDTRAVRRPRRAASTHPRERPSTAPSGRWIPYVIGALVAVIAIIAAVRFVVRPLLFP